MGLGTIAKGLGAWGLGAATGLAAFSVKKLQTNDQDNAVLAIPRNHNFPWRWYPSYKNMPDLKKHHNIMAQVLSTPLYADLYKLSTPNGFTIDHVIQTGVDNPGHPHILTVGAVAGDEETYEVFAPLLDQIIELRHNGYCPEDKHPTTLPSKDEEDDFFAKINGGAFDETYVLSVRCRTGRNVRGLSLPPMCSRAERREVEEVVTRALHNRKLDCEFRGRYYKMPEMSEELQQQLIDEHYLFDKPVSPLLTSAGMARDWPDARGIFHNHKKTFIVWINEEDHMRVISMQKGGNLKEVFERWCRGLRNIEKNVLDDGWEYQYNDHLGYIATCPSNLGTGMRAGVHIRLPYLSQHCKFDDLLEKLRLQKRGVGGVDSPQTGCIYDISNVDRLGKSELTLIQLVIDGVNELVDCEKALENGQDISPRIMGMAAKN